MPGEKQQTGVSRRTLVKSAALGSLALAAGGVSRAHFTKPNIVIKPNANSRPTGDTTGYLANPKEV
ncbi:hypothetical protein AH798_000948 [Salmonella enterica subsp. enterica serovar Mbandaka]|nr:hypothetical protein [Salmonella enterica subsp. enterica serovar Mbandaka]